MTITSLILSKRQRILVSSVFCFSVIFLSACTTDPSIERYYKTADERGVQLNEDFVIVSTIRERDGVELSRVELSRTDNAGPGYKLLQEGNQIQIRGHNESRYFHLINLKKWRDQTLNSDFVRKLDNSESALNAFLADVNDVYVGGAGRVYLQSIVHNGTQKILDLSDANKDIQLIQKDRTVTMLVNGDSPRVFEFDESRFNSIPKGDNWSIAFFETVSGAIMLANETRTMFTIIEKVKNKGLLFTNIAIEDGLFKLEGGKYKYVTLYEDYTVENLFLMPARNYACAELTQIYYDRLLATGVEVASSIILGIIQSYVNYSSTTMSGHAYSNTGSTYVVSGYSTTRDYSFIGDRANDIIGSAAYGDQTVSEIKSTMARYHCIVP